MLDVVQAVSESAASDAEIVATVAYLINSSKVLLCSTFAGAQIDLSVPTRNASPFAIICPGVTSGIVRNRPSDDTMNCTFSDEWHSKSRTERRTP